MRYFLSNSDIYILSRCRSVEFEVFQDQFTESVGFNPFQSGLAFEVTVTQQLGVDTIFNASRLSVIGLYDSYLDKRTQPRTQCHNFIFRKRSAITVWIIACEFGGG